MFDRVVVISLERRPDRLAGFWERLPPDVPFPRPVVFAGIDGQAERPPAWWKTSAGAWGCLRSHQLVIASALADGVDRLLVLEDDCAFAPDFSARLSSVGVPADCDQLYLGGEHLKPPAPAGPGLVRGVNINRTHAYAVIGRPALQLVARQLEPGPHWPARHHVDHIYGAAHKAGTIAAYAIKPWICGQAAGLSDISGRTCRERAFT